MSLKNLLEMSKSEVAELKKFAVDRTLNMGVHPLWYVFQIRYGSFPHVGLNINLKDYIDRISDEIDSSYRHIKMLYYDGIESKDIEPILFGEEFDHEQGHLTEFRLKKTREYLKILQKFFGVYESLRVASFLMNLGDNESLCVFVLPKDGISSFLSYYKDYLGSLTRDYALNFIFLESEESNRGEIHRPYEKKDGSKLTKKDLTYTKKLDAVERLCESLDIIEINLFGEFINKCIKGTENSLKLYGFNNVNVMLDVSITCHELIEQILSYPGKEDKNNSKLKDQIIEIRGEESYKKIYNKLNQLLKNPCECLDYPIRNTLKDPKDQLKMFGEYPPIIEVLTEIKEWYSYQHNNKIHSGFKV